jgi:hypothetical protein
MNTQPCLVILRVFVVKAEPDPPRRHEKLPPFPTNAKPGEQAAEKEYNVFAESNTMYLWKSLRKLGNLSL